MPLSQGARRAVRAATTRNPSGAQQLLDMMRTAPEVGKRKPTRYGPLSVILRGQRLPPEEIRLYEAFTAEWLRGDFEVLELADAVESALREVTGRRQDPRRHRLEGWRTLAGQPRSPGALLGRDE